MLTSVNTFVGLLPLMLETSRHAQFLIPMAVSLGFGVAFATVITLYLIPCSRLVAEDSGLAASRLKSWYLRRFRSPTGRTSTSQRDSDKPIAG
jgi:hypothetical protein